MSLVGMPQLILIQRNVPTVDIDLGVKSSQ